MVAEGYFWGIGADDGGKRSGARAAGAGIGSGGAPGGVSRVGAGVGENYARTYKIMKRKDEVLEEVRSARDAYASRFDYDLARMFQDLKEKEDEHPTRRAGIPPVKPATSSRPK